jgi:hypothetical protein
LLEWTSKSPATHGYLAFQAYGIKALYPEFEYEKFLTPEAIKLMDVVNKGCWYVTLATFNEKVPQGKMVLPEAKDNPYFLKFREMNLLGLRRAHGPIFLAQGLMDTTILTETVDDAYKSMRDQGTIVEYKKYPSLDHDSLVFGSYRDQVRWVQDRFDGKPVAPKE